mgnify:CR=1 FL=1
MTVRQAAEEWQLNPATIRKAIREGYLPAIWAGNGYRVIAADVEAWIQRTWGTRFGSAEDPPDPQTNL